jgi:hypothetical protein
MCGFDLGVLPDESQFYRFLKNTKNSTLKTIHKTANDLLIENGLLSLDEFILDSKPIQAATKENNFKNPNRNTTNKAKKPKRNPRATLSYYSCQVINGKKQNMIFFCGYRTHAVVTKEGICLVEKTLPNNITDQEAAFSLIRELKRRYRFKKGAKRLQKNTTMLVLQTIHHSIQVNATAVQNILMLPMTPAQEFPGTAKSSKIHSRTDRPLNSISLALATEKQNRQPTIRLPP